MSESVQELRTRQQAERRAQAGKPALGPNPFAAEQAASDARFSDDANKPNVEAAAKPKRAPKPKGGKKK